MTTKTQAKGWGRFRLDRNSPLLRFWQWWSGELQAAMPRWLKPSEASANRALLIEVSPAAIIVRRWEQGKLIELGRINRQAGDLATHSIAFQALLNKTRQGSELIALWLPSGQFLSKELPLPLAAEENLRQVLGFEMDRNTPFKADQVYFDYRVLGRDAQTNRITVQLVAVPRQTIDNAQELLSRWGAPLQAAYIASAVEANSAAINLIPSERRAAPPAPLRGVNLVLLLVTILLGLGAISIPIVVKRQASIDLIPLVERAKQAAGATDNTKRELEKLQAEYNFMLDKKKAALPAIVLLDELTRLLPDDTWVQQLTVNGKEMQIQGETGSSSKLITLVDNARVFRDANFRSPISKGNAPNSERYHLAAEIKPLPPETFAANAPPPPAIQAAATPAPAPAPDAGAATPAGQTASAQSPAKPGPDAAKPSQPTSSQAPAKAAGLAAPGNPAAPASSAPVTAAPALPAPAGATPAVAAPANAAQAPGPGLPAGTPPAAQAAPATPVGPIPTPGSPNAGITPPQPHAIKAPQSGVKP